MKLQEKSAFTQKKPVYDAIPLIIIDKMERRHFYDHKENLRYQAVSPFWMKIRLLLFWTLWAALIMLILGVILKYFCITPQLCHSSNTNKNTNNNRNRL